MRYKDAENEGGLLTCNTTVTYDRDHVSLFGSVVATIAEPLVHSCLAICRLAVSS